LERQGYVYRYPSPIGAPCWECDSGLCLFGLSACLYRRPQEVSEKMDAQAAERAKQLVENAELKAKLDAFMGQFDSFNTIVRTREAGRWCSQSALSRFQLWMDALRCLARGVL
jgi:hypothetical protein